MSSSITSPQIENETASASGSERKKRNKLSYPKTPVACTSCVGTEHTQEYPDRSTRSTQVQMQNVYHPQHNQPPSAPAQAYWTANHPTQLIYQQQQFSVANASALPPQDPQLQHSNQDIGSLRGAAPPSFGSMPTSDTGQSPSTYQQYGNTFPKMQRTITIPAVQSQSSRDRVAMGMRSSPQIGAGQAQGQYAYDQMFPPQFTHGAPWYTPRNAQQAFGPHHLPSQDQSCGHPDWQG
ncbi:hypothetical protein LTR64_002815 [Lithohypha guttulata]|uniref:uncharacterized protein n=1 Tax=Lithohypha guttulata TaxID=1690604 RepID=UPI002DE12C2C|nr:hypothetical protein LTR70_007403 [Exophiala xenobiotica]